jgi:DNA invertase Pin-like site-specific DNA recombinase
MSKITAEHLSRSAYVYIRQSTVGQLQHNPESRRRQYSLVDRARRLGWTDVVVIDDDLGLSGSGVIRPGFERLLAAICCGTVGTVVAIEASRLARNGRDWHTLLEFCALVDTLIVDEDGVYDPRSVNDRLLLGMKGTLSEMELSLLRQRSVEAIKLKAKRGDLHTTVAIGYVRGAGDRIEKDPDQRIREAIDLVFQKFAELHSVRQVLLWLRQEAMELPSAGYGPEGRAVTWKLPIYNTILHILSNPVYAGAYAFGRTGSRVRIHEGRKCVVRGIRRAREQWEVLLTGHHEGYIAWEAYEHNQQVIADNANMKGEMVRGAVRRGEALLAGLLRCGHCGRKLHVAYSGGASQVSRYHCRGATINHGASGRCIAFGALRVDQAVAVEVLRVLQPLGLEASLQAIDQQMGESDAKRRQLELALEQARFEVARAQRQYDTVDPENRLVAAELERRWNERLGVVARLEQELTAVASAAKPTLSEVERARLVELSSDLERAWNHPAASPEIRKRLLRSVVKEIVVQVGTDELELKVHWQGGHHTALRVPKNRTGSHRWKTDAGTEELIHTLARLMPDPAIAALLNRCGRRTGKGHTWTESRVRSFRGDHQISVYREGERAERGELTLEEAGKALQVSDMTVLRMIQRGILPARQLCKGAPWVIRTGDLDLEVVRAGVMAGLKRPLTADSRQISIEFQ